MTRVSLGRRDTVPTLLTASDILSEGEQSVVAVASFLAELQTASHNGGIVFDDPVCSRPGFHDCVFGDNYLDMDGLENRSKLQRPRKTWERSRGAACLTRQPVFGGLYCTYHSERWLFQPPRRWLF